MNNFVLRKVSGQVLFRLDTPGLGISDMIYFDSRGAQLWDTTYPQEEIDYDYGSNRLKVIGVDLI
jgi:hypothetical protein